MRPAPRSLAELRQSNEHRCERLVARSALLDTRDIRWEDAPAVELDDAALAASSTCATSRASRPASSAAGPGTRPRWRRTWTPVGVGGDDKQPIEFDRVLAYLAGGEPGHAAVAVMDRTIARLPGFAGLAPYARAAEASLARVAAERVSPCPVGVVAAAASG